MGVRRQADEWAERWAGGQTEGWTEEMMGGWVPDINATSGSKVTVEAELSLV